METVLERWERTPHPPFVAKPRYYTAGDFITYFKSDERCTAFQLNPYVEIYHNDQNECIGIRIIGVKKLVGSGEFTLEHLLQAAVSKCRLVPVEESKLIDLIENQTIVVKEPE